MSFYFALIAFIASVVIGVISFIIGKAISREKITIIISVHGIFLLAFLTSLFLRKDVNSDNYFFLFFICSGVILSGIVWKSNLGKVFKLYFSLFILTIAMFILSPSRLANFLLTNKYVDTIGETFLVAENYFIERQNSSMHNDQIPRYKLIQKKGIFHSTIQRDLDFGGKLDSIKVIEFDKSNLGLIRGYTSITSHVSTTIDSTDTEISFKKKTNDGLEYRL